MLCACVCTDALTRVGATGRGKGGAGAGTGTGTGTAAGAGAGTTAGAASSSPDSEELLQRSRRALERPSERATDSASPTPRPLRRRSGMLRASSPASEEELLSKWRCVPHTGRCRCSSSSRLASRKERQGAIPASSSTQARLIWRNDRAALLRVGQRGGQGRRLVVHVVPRAGTRIAPHDVGRKRRVEERRRWWCSNSPPVKPPRMRAAVSSLSAPSKLLRRSLSRLSSEARPRRSLRLASVALLCSPMASSASPAASARDMSCAATSVATPLASHNPLLSTSEPLALPLFDEVRHRA